MLNQGVCGFAHVCRHDGEVALVLVGYGVYGFAERVASFPEAAAHFVEETIEWGWVVSVSGGRGLE